MQQRHPGSRHANKKYVDMFRKLSSHVYRNGLLNISQRTLALEYPCLNSPGNPCYAFWRQNGLVVTRLS